jgi:hypothetical protein
MSKISNNSTQNKKVTTTSKHLLGKLDPILLKGIGSIILAGFSLLIKYQSPRLVITFSTEISQSNQEYKALISVCFSTREKLPDWKK